MTKAKRRGIVLGLDTRIRLESAKLRLHIAVELLRLLEAAVAEIESHHRAAARPVPRSVNVQPFEQRLVALEQLLQRAQEEALAETPRAGEEVARAALDQGQYQACLVDIVGILFAQIAEGLDADGEEFLGHAYIIAHDSMPPLDWIIPAETTVAAVWQAMRRQPTLANRYLTRWRKSFPPEGTRHYFVIFVPRDVDIE